MQLDLVDSLDFKISDLVTNRTNIRIAFGFTLWFLNRKKLEMQVVAVFQLTGAAYAAELRKINFPIVSQDFIHDDCLYILPKCHMLSLLCGGRVHSPDMDREQREKKTCDNLQSRALCNIILSSRPHFLKFPSLAAWG